MMPRKLAEALKTTSRSIADIDSVKLIWWHFYQMYRILRKENAQLKEGRSVGSTNVEDYEFGLKDEEIAAYVNHANIFHSLMVFRYGCRELTPYMMKFVDVVPKHLCSTPFKSLMRVATEGGERTHYMHICFYYQVCLLMFVNKPYYIYINNSLLKALQRVAIQLDHLPCVI